jgi:N utilization substance protein A
LRDGDRDLLREAREALAGGPDDFMLLGRQPRLVRPDGTISLRDKSFGPLEPDLVGMSVDVEVIDGKLHVFYNRDLRAKYDFETGAGLPLYDDVGAVNE